MEGAMSVMFFNDVTDRQDVDNRADSMSDPLSPCNTYVNVGVKEEDPMINQCEFDFDLLPDDWMSQPTNFTEYSSIEPSLGEFLTRTEADMEDLNKSHSLPLDWEVGSTTNTLSPPADAISDEDLINLPLKELNQRLGDFPRDVVLELKKRRRTIKNRGYALNCRVKRKNKKQVLEGKNVTLEDQVERLQNRLAAAEKERDFYKSRCSKALKMDIKLGHLTQPN